MQVLYGSNHVTDLRYFIFARDHFLMQSHYVYNACQRRIHCVLYSLTFYVCIPMSSLPI